MASMWDSSLFVLVTFWKNSEWLHTTTTDNNITAPDEAANIWGGSQSTLFLAFYCNCCEPVTFLENRHICWKKCKHQIKTTWRLIQNKFPRGGRVREQKRGHVWPENQNTEHDTPAHNGLAPYENPLKPRCLCVSGVCSLQQRTEHRVWILSQGVRVVKLHHLDDTHAHTQTHAHTHTHTHTHTYTQRILYW